MYTEIAVDTLPEGVGLLHWVQNQIVHVALCGYWLLRCLQGSVCGPPVDYTHNAQISMMKTCITWAGNWLWIQDHSPCWPGSGRPHSTAQHPPECTGVIIIIIVSCMGRSKAPPVPLLPLCTKRYLKCWMLLNDDVILALAHPVMAS